MSTQLRNTPHRRGLASLVIDGFLHWLLDERRSSYGLALMRIGMGGMTVVILAMYLPNFSYTFGEGARWGEAFYRSSSVNDFIWPISALFSRDEPDGVRLAKTLLLMAIAVVYLLGWRMRITAPVFTAMWLGFTGLNPVVFNTGHYQTFRVFLLFLLLADTSRRWSLDARRRSRQGEDPPLGWGSWHLPRWVPVLANNAAVILIGYQLCVIYVSSALWKLQGHTWASGVASYYPLQIDELTIFPALSHLAWQITPLVFITTWVSVYGQLLFPLMLLTRPTRIIGLILVTGMHASIAVLLALPWFSLVMILGDMIFIRDDTWRHALTWVRQRDPRFRLWAAREPRSAASTNREPSPSATL
ncbi:HTTM domain-containing protein [Leucobacter sp. VD1]|uniref:HTTM domain-containing protein n=1 Tax=Leucobacter sp. VD1 TaxID=3080381 RepID=UPI0030191049